MRASALISVLLLTGCYNYLPVESPAPASGTRVAAELTAAGSLEMASQVGLGVTTLRGKVVGGDPEALVLAITSALGRHEEETLWNGEQVRIPLALVAQVRERKFALGKSLLFGGAVGGGLLGAVKAFTGGGSAGGITGGGGGPGPQ
jgi:hypothetical protein